ncbi:MAG: SRPBCC family protein [Bacteroidota bacterium]
MHYVCLLAPLMLMMSVQAQSPKQKSTRFSHQLSTKASAETIWQIWTEVDEWHQWDKGLQKASLHDPWQIGAKGTLRSLENRKVKFTVTEFEPGKSYTFKSNLPLGGLYVKRSLERQGDQVLFTHEVWFQGLTKGIFARLLGKDFQAMLPQVMENIKVIAEAP